VSRPRYKMVGWFGVHPGDGSLMFTPSQDQVDEWERVGIEVVGAFAMSTVQTDAEEE